MAVVTVALFVAAVCPLGGEGMWGIFGTGLHAVLTTRLRFFVYFDFWNVSKWQGGAYKSSTSHLDHLQNPVLIRDDKIKWLDFGVTQDPENLQPHPGFSG